VDEPLLKKLQKLSVRIQIHITVEDLMCLSSALCTVIMALALSHRPPFISFLWDHNKHSILFLLFLGIFEFYMIFFTCGGILYLTNYLTLYMIFTNHWMNWLTKQQQYIGDSFEGQLVPFKIKCFQKLKILNNHFNHSHTSYAFPMTLLMFFVASTFTLFGSIRLQELTPIVEYMLFPLACAFLLIIFAMLLYGSALVYGSSKKFLQDWKRNSAFVFCQTRSETARQRILTKRVFKCLRPFGVQIGTLQFITKLSVILVFADLSNYTASLLIAFPFSYFI
jgi:hypothetical protein